MVTDKKNSRRFISGAELFANEGVVDFEVFDYLKEGLQPYDKFGKPIECRFSYHRASQILNSVDRITKRIKELQNIDEFEKKLKSEDIIEIEYNEFLSELLYDLNIFKENKESIRINKSDLRQLKGFRDKLAKKNRSCLMRCRESMKAILPTHRGDTLSSRSGQ
jgi:hypothetical protein